MSEQLLPGYTIHAGSSLDRALLVKFMQLTYQELFPEQDFSHLAHTVEQFFSKETPLWWVEFLGKGQVARGEGQEVEFLGKRQEARGEGQEEESTPPATNASSAPPAPIACLWVGNAIDQVRGDRHAHIFLLYVKPEHRRLGIGKALMRYVENWAMDRGDRFIGLQVFESNTPALNLYHQLGYQTQSLWMIKPIKNQNS